jgi:adenosylcobinamide kinase / adenosylcobinamide-phosphate guanylyltransferase
MSVIEPLGAVHPAEKHLILGGARSGKSRFAQECARAHCGEVCVVATAEGRDAEMQARIARHQADRPLQWETVEEPLAVTEVLTRLSAPHRLMVVDCLTLWISNHLAKAATFPCPHWEATRDALIDSLPHLPGPVLLVANEVGLGLVPNTPLGRFFRDEAGFVNQALARVCERVQFVVAGLPLCLKAPHHGPKTGL